MKSKEFGMILKAVADATELSPAAILSRCRKAELIAARSMFVHFCVKRGLPIGAIADYIGRKKIECVSNYRAAFYTLNASSPYFSDLIRLIERQLPLSIR